MEYLLLFFLFFYGLPRSPKNIGHHLCTLPILICHVLTPPLLHVQYLLTWEKNTFSFGLKITKTTYLDTKLLSAYILHTKLSQQAATICTTLYLHTIYISV